MLEMLKNWYSRRLSDPQAMGLLAILLFGFIAIYFFSDLIAPLLIAIVLAYLLEMPINFLTKNARQASHFWWIYNLSVINFLRACTYIMESNDFLIK